jgi:hypothetical protein
MSNLLDVLGHLSLFLCLYQYYHSIDGLGIQLQFPSEVFESDANIAKIVLLSSEGAQGCDIFLMRL